MPDVYRFEIERRGEVIDTHDLLSQMRVIEGSWREVPQGSRVVTTCTLARADTAPGIRTTSTDLEEFMRRAIDYEMDHLESHECWFRWQTSGEGEKRALVYSYHIEPLDNEVYDIHLENGAARYIFTFGRDADFEELEAQTASQNNIRTIGGYVNLISSIFGGSTHGRIETLILKPTHASQNLYKAWVGIRPERYGIGAPVEGNISSGFHPVINFDLGSQADPTYTALSVPSVTNSYNGFFVVRDSFADGDGMTIKLEESVASDYYVGRYLVLLRARLTGVGLCSARIGTALGGFGNVGEFYEKPLSLGNTQYISNTDFRFTELGIIDIPGDRASHVPYRSNINIFLETGRLSGSVSLDTDCLVLIPADHYVTWDHASFGNVVTGGLQGDAYIHTSPEGGASGLVVDPTLTGGAAAGSIGGLAYDYAELGGAPAGWAYPRHGGFLVVAAERETVQQATDNLNVEIHVRRRWRMYRT